MSLINFEDAAKKESANKLEAENRETDKQFAKLESAIEKFRKSKAEEISKLTGSSEIIVNIKDCESVKAIKFLCPICNHDNYLPTYVNKIIETDDTPLNYIIHSCLGCGQEIILK